MLEESSEHNGFPPSVARLESPSLIGTGTGATAFEMKFLVTSAQAEQIQRWAREHLGLDPYANAARNDSYETTTLYFDTPHYDVFKRSPGFRRHKFRMRRYNGASTLFAECKTRRGDEVAKQRCTLPLEELARFQDTSPTNDWSGADYHRALWERSLQPSCRMTYDRSAYLGRDRSGAIRLTLDRHIRGTLCNHWQTTPLSDGVTILSDEVICELKFRECMPMLFKQLVANFRLESSSVSKYRRMLTALGLNLPEHSVPPEDPNHV
jgi:hypothetical protein